MTTEMGVDVIKPDRASFSLVETEAPSFRSLRVDALYRYWLSRRNDALPTRADIDPADIKSLLPYVLIVDIHRDPFRIYYRLVGTAVVHFSGLDFTGTFLDELAFDICATSDLVNAYRAVCDAKQPGIGMAFAQLNHHTALDVEYLICPLVDAAGTVAQCLVLEDYVAKEGMDIGRLRLARPA
ncbi:PAS domain-containing protein [Dongia rigui]|uniref:PAS domain-containing protein n=1 Tax=Dongia rigui TaxID=940149 RepID=A0ABU5DW33_9PROT|nr:PAS domain-containing protein [Dongia rigui]MDY0871515.1 PAS domain-containing protein [Dongia rigui]